MIPFLNTASKIFPVLLGVLFTICLWFLQRPEKTALSKHHETDKVQGYMTQISALYFNELGHCQYQLSSPQSTHYSLNNRTHFSDPQLMLYENPNKKPWILKAKSGEALNDFYSVILHDVEIRQNADFNHPQTDIFTNILTYFPKNKTAVTEAPILFSQPQGFARSKGFRADFAQGIFDFHTNVQGQYASFD